LYKRYFFGNPSFFQDMGRFVKHESFFFQF
ncbi:hypothetical protein BAE44_0020745, partial [Dichanthelium oligosanthes]